MAEFKQRFSPSSLSSSSGLPAFLSSSPHLESNGAPSLRDIVAEQTRGITPGITGCTTPASETPVVTQTGKPSIIVDNRKFDLNSWLTNKTFLMLLSFLVLIAIIFIGFMLVNKNRSKKKLNDADDNDDDSDKHRRAGAGCAAGAAGGLGGGSVVTRSPKVESELSNHTNDIKFLMAQVAQLTSKVQQLEKSSAT